MPSGFSMSGGICQLAGTGISTGNCISVPSNNTIKVINFNTSSNNISPLSLTLTLPLTMSQSVATYSFTVNTLSGNNIVDTGSASLTTTSRTLTNS